MRFYLEDANAVGQTLFWEHCLQHPIKFIGKLALKNYYKVVYVVDGGEATDA